MFMKKNKEEYQYPTEATPAQVGELARKFEEMRQMTGSDGRHDKPKPKKKVMVPVEIPPIISVPRYRHSDTITTKHYTKLPESYNTGPETPVGLSQRFTQDKLREGKILKQLDQQLTNERKNSETTNKGGDTDRPV